jgi:hypothetical protein
VPESADLHPGDFLYVFRNAETPDAEFRAVVTDVTGRETFALTLVPSPTDSELPTDEAPEYLTVYAVVRIERAAATER